MTMRALRTIKKPSSGDTLAIIISALKVVKATSDAISSVPLLGIVASAALALTATLEVINVGTLNGIHLCRSQKVHGNKEQCAQLARRIENLIEHITARIHADPDSVSPAMNEDLELLHRYVTREPSPFRNEAVLMVNHVRSLTRIQQEVDRESRRSFLSRFMHQDTVASMISRNMQELGDAWRSFDVSAGFRVDMTVALLTLSTPLKPPKTACLVTLDQEVRVMRVLHREQARYDGQSQVR